MVFSEATRSVEVVVIGRQLASREGERVQVSTGADLITDDIE